MKSQSYPDVIATKASTLVQRGKVAREVEYSGVVRRVPVLSILIEPPSGKLITAQEALDILKPKNVRALEAQYGKKPIAIEIPRKYDPTCPFEINLDSCTIRDRPGIIYVRVNPLFE